MRRLLPAGERHLVEAPVLKCAANASLVRDHLDADAVALEPFLQDDVAEAQRMLHMAAQFAEVARVAHRQLHLCRTVAAHRA